MLVAKRRLPPARPRRQSPPAGLHRLMQTQTAPFWQEFVTISLPIGYQHKLLIAGCIPERRQGAACPAGSSQNRLSVEPAGKVGTGHPAVTGCGPSRQTVDPSGVPLLQQHQAGGCLQNTRAEPSSGCPGRRTTRSAQFFTAHTRSCTPSSLLPQQSRDGEKACFGAPSLNCHVSCPNRPLSTQLPALVAFRISLAKIPGMPRAAWTLCRSSRNLAGMLC